MTERQAEHRSGYFAGEVFPMPVSSEAHNLITGNLIFGLHAKLRGSECQVFANSMRVRIIPRLPIIPRDIYTYPDIVVVCGERIFEQREKDTLLNPTLVIIVERKSNMNPRIPRINARHYAQIASL